MKQRRRLSVRSTDCGLPGRRIGQVFLFFIFKILRSIYLFIAAGRILVVVFGIHFFDQGLKLSPCIGSTGVLATGPLGKSQDRFF